MIIVFCGIPGAGKTTIVQELLKELEKDKKTYKLFVSDKVGSQVYKKVLEFLKQNQGQFDFLIFDATFYKKKWREMVFKQVGRGEFLLIYLDCSLETCLQRNKKREPRVPEKAVHIIYHQMEKPKNPDIVINTEKIGPKKAAKIILKRIKL